MVVTCAHPFSTWHTIVSQLSSLSTWYNKGGANHPRMQRRIQADSVFHVGIPLLRKPIWSLLSGQGCQKIECHFLKLRILLGFPWSLSMWQADLPLTPSTLQQDHQGPASFIHDIEPQLLDHGFCFTPNFVLLVPCLSASSPNRQYSSTVHILTSLSWASVKVHWVSRHGLLAQCHGLKRQVTGEVQVDVWDCRCCMLGSWTGFPKLAYYVAFIVFINVKGGCCHDVEPGSKCW
jgi:hypothetical protein